METNIKIQSFYGGIIEGEEDNYEDFIGYCPRPMKLEVTVSTQEEVDKLIDFLTKIRVALLPNN